MSFFERAKAAATELAAKADDAISNAGLSGAPARSPRPTGCSVTSGSSPSSRGPAARSTRPTASGSWLPWAGSRRAGRSGS